MNNQKTVWLTAFFRFSHRGSEYGFERIHLQHIWETKEEALKHISFCDETGWYEGVLIEERAFGWNPCYKGKRVWMLQNELGQLNYIEEPNGYENIVYLVS